MIRCKKCGSSLPDDAKFCNICGTSVEEADIQAAQTTETTTAAPVAAQESENTATVNQEQQFNNGTQFNGGAQFNNNGQQFNSGAQFNNNNGQQFNGGNQFNNNNGQQFNGGAQFNGNGGQNFQQAAPKETASTYYGKQQYAPIAQDNVANKGAAICAYFGLLWLVPLLTAKHSPFAKFHTNQAILVFIVSVIVNIITGIFRTIFTNLAWNFWDAYGFFMFVAGIFTVIGLVIPIALSIVGIVFAAQGKIKEIPVLGQFHLLK